MAWLRNTKGNAWALELEFDTIYTSKDAYVHVVLWWCPRNRTPGGEGIVTTSGDSPELSRSRNVGVGG